MRPNRSVRSWLATPLLAALSLSLAAPLHAQAPKAPAGMRGEILAWIEDAESKLLQLAEATPQEKYAWRPGEGVRSQAEVFLHVAAGNYRIPSMWGVKPPEGFAFDGYETSLTDKAAIQQALRASFAHLKEAYLGLSEKDLAKQTNVFGQDVTVRWGYLLILSHAHEHLGQSIAYARTNGIVPPWSAGGGEGGGGGNAQ